MFQSRAVVWHKNPFLACLDQELKLLGFGTSPLCLVGLRADVTSIASGVQMINSWWKEQTSSMGSCYGSTVHQRSGKEILLRGINSILLS